MPTDVRLNYRANLVYRVPDAFTPGSVAGALLNTWQVAAIVQATSGQPFTPTVGGDPANLGHTGYARPNLVSDPELSNPTAERWFNAAAFAIPVNEFGNAGRNRLRGPGWLSYDMSVQRRIDITGRVNAGSARPVMRSCSRYGRMKRVEPGSGREVRGSNIMLARTERPSASVPRLRPRFAEKSPDRSAWSKPPL